MNDSFAADAATVAAGAVAVVLLLFVFLGGSWPALLRGVAWGGLGAGAVASSLVLGPAPQGWPPNVRVCTLCASVASGVAFAGAANLLQTPAHVLVPAACALSIGSRRLLRAYPKQSSPPCSPAPPSPSALPFKHCDLPTCIDVSDG
ncbi:hypothetical protein DIPPA_24730 [Diplonema papillatum]|nr:hypothetical protein DIPPA_24730 [Diplonema papillatum]